MPRSISVSRRRANLVDLTVRRRPGVRAFQFKAAANFDAAFTLFETVPNVGVRNGPPDIGPDAACFKDQVRFLFNPDLYTATAPGCVDANPFFILIAPVSDAGVVGSDEAMHLLLPYSSAPNRPVVLQGNIPSGAGLANSIEIQLPMQCNDFDIQNDGGADLYVAFERPGFEYRVQPVTTAFKTFEQTYTSVSQLFLRGAGGATVMSATFTLRNNPTY
jgi:hypothetical protein